MRTKSLLHLPLLFVCVNAASYVPINNVKINGSPMTTKRDNEPVDVLGYLSDYTAIKISDNAVYCHVVFKLPINVVLSNGTTIQNPACTVPAQDFYMDTRSKLVSINKKTKNMAVECTEDLKTSGWYNTNSYHLLKVDIHAFPDNITSYTEPLDKICQWGTEFNNLDVQPEKTSAPVCDQVGLDARSQIALLLIFGMFYCMGFCSGVRSEREIIERRRY